MNALAGFRGVLSKELNELFREKRLAIVLVILGLFITIPLSFFVMGFMNSGYPVSYAEVAYPLAYMGPLALIIIAITFGADAVSKEQDSGMLALILVSPVSPGGLLFAKITSAFIAYGLVATMYALVYTSIALAVGVIAIRVVFLLFLIPFLALFLFLMGVASTVSVLTSASRSAIAISFGLFFILFLLMPQEPGLGFLIRNLAPGVYAWLAFNPLGAAIASGLAIVSGSPFDWLPLITTTIAGIALIAFAYWRVTRLEVSA